MKNRITTKDIVKLEGKLNTYLNYDDAGVEVWLATETPLVNIEPDLTPEQAKDKFYHYNVNRIWHNFKGKKISIEIKEIV